MDNLTCSNCDGLVENNICTNCGFIMDEDYYDISGGIDTKANIDHKKTDEFVYYSNQRSRRKKEQEERKVKRLRRRKQNKSNRSKLKNKLKKQY